MFSTKSHFFKTSVIFTIFLWYINYFKSIKNSKKYFLLKKLSKNPVYDKSYVGDSNSYVGDNKSYVGDNESYVGVSNSYIGDNISYVGDSKVCLSEYLG